MPKDPAFLFYPGDWQTGTMTLSRHLKGCFMDLLVAQFNSGPLTLEEIKTVLASDFGSCWPTLQKKFTVDQHGRFFNVRLETEKQKRAVFTQSRLRNLSKKTPNTEPHMEHRTVSHMEDEDISLNGIGIKEKKGVQGKEKELSPLEKAIADFVEMRKRIRKPLTARAKDMLLTKLEELSGGDEAVKIQILDKSTFNSWQGVFPLKSEQKATVYESGYRPYQED